MKKFLVLSISVFIVCASFATEGMWIPTLLKAVEDDMQAMGLELSAEDIYSINKSSLKDAIVHFGGGCTAELISSQGLLLTNHHCGYSQIQSHSSLENNYLRDGFWAKSLEEELPNEGLTATLIDRIVDVTALMYKGITDSMDDSAVASKLAENASAIETTYKKGNLDAKIRAYNYGNSYFVIVTKTYNDVRLVGTPPDAVGKFGGDTDNWVWPRHTGDFSIFRIYAGTDNEPAEYASENQPYQPKQHLKVSMNGIEEGDFTMVFGFPGSTEQYLISDAVDYVMNVSNPMKIHMRDESLNIIDAAMRASEKTKIQYASKQSGISNAWKKWKGQNRGLKRMDALNRKKELETSYAEKAKLSGNSDYITVIDDLKAIYAKNQSYQQARDLFIEYYYYGPEIISFAVDITDFCDAYEQAESEQARKELIAKYEKKCNNYFDDYDAEVDQDIFKALTPLYSSYLDDNLEPIVFLEAKADWKAYTKSVYKNKVLTNRESCLEFLKSGSSGKMKKLKKSAAAVLGNQVVNVFYAKALPEYRANSGAINSKMKTFVKGLMEFYPEKDYWSDANSTLRLTYGKAEGSEPNDGMAYKFFTTADGILDKHSKELKDYELPQDLVDLLKTEEYGEYADKDGELHVCFTGSNHTTGGNSGSPALNGKGHLVGLNFDRSWESTMSDIMFDPDQCRNIMVDIRYVLFIIDKYAGATRLIEEMDLVKKETKDEVSTHSINGRKPYYLSCTNEAEPSAEENCTQQEIMKYISKNVDYPQIAIENDISGTVFVELLIDEKGNVSSTNILRKAHPALDREAERVIKSLPKFQPGTLKGEAVKMKYTLPVAFKLR